MKVTVLGAGYVGLVTGACLASLGHDVTCVDVVKERIDKINRGAAPFHEPGIEGLIQEGLESGRILATSDFDRAMDGSQISIIAVGTPEKGGRHDLGYLEAVSAQIGWALPQLGHYHVVAVKSTVIPGTSDTFVRSILEKNSGMSTGEFGLCMNPEFLREGSAVADFMDPDRIVIGQWDDRAGKVLMELYEAFKCPKLITTLRNAELIKCASNALLATLISFSNEISRMCEATYGTDEETIMKCLHLDRRLSPRLNGERLSPGILSYLRGGSGFGGSCLPKDVNSLRIFARNQKIDAPLLDAVMQINESRPHEVVSIVEEETGKLKNCHIAVLGLAFKPETDDMRESPAIRMIDCMLDAGATVRGYDPLATPAAASVLDSRVVLYDDPKAALRGVDAALIATAWPEFSKWDWSTLSATMRRPLIIDSRNALRGVQLPQNITYRPIGKSRAKN